MTNEGETLTAERPSFSESISSLEFSVQCRCHGTFSDNGEPNSERETASFNYKYADCHTTNLIAKDETRHDELKEKLDELGLNDIYFQAFKRDESDPSLPHHTYVLLHGWTANHKIYSEVKRDNQLTIVEEILARDPGATVIAMDGNGFGETTFRDDITGKELGAKCTAEAYAKQVDFLLTEVLGAKDEDKSDIRIAGHSMGGAATYFLAAEHGYQGLALAPAAFPTKESIATAKAVYANDQTKIEAVLQAGDETSKYVAKVLYQALATATAFGDTVQKINGRLGIVAEFTTGMVFDAIGGTLMGKELPKTQAVALMKIHQSELTANKLRVVSQTIGNLAKGINFDNWTAENLTALENVTTATGTSDVLVPEADYRNCAATAWTKLWTLTPKDNAELARANLEPISHLLTPAGNIEIDGGHYSPLGSEKTIATLTKSFWTAPAWLSPEA